MAYAVTEAGGNADVDVDASGMRHNDDRLQEMLRLAKACLKTGRCPGDPRAKHLFQRFDAEEEAARAEAAAAAREEAETSGEPRVPTPPPVAPTPEGCTPAERAAKLRRDVRDLARANAERRSELEAVERELKQEVLERYRVNDELRDAKFVFSRSQRELREIRDMKKMQEREIQTLRLQLDKLSVKQREPIHPMLAPLPPPGSGGRADQGGAKSSRCPTADSAPPGRAASQHGAESEARSGSAPAPPVCVDALKSVLLKDEKLPASEAKLWGHLQSENEKLASVIDAVGELSRELRSPLSARGGGSASRDAAGLPPTGAGGAAAQRSKAAKARQVANAAGLTILPMPKEQAYASVLASRPKHYKLYIV